MVQSLELRLQADESRYTWARFIEDVAGRYGENTAIRFDGADISYRALHDDSRRLAKALAAAGVVKGMRVAIHMANRPEFAVASFAVAMVGAVLVPINTFAIKQEREYLLRHSDASVLIFQSHLLKYNFYDELCELLPQITAAQAGAIACATLPFLRRVICLDTSGTAYTASRTAPAIESWDEFAIAGEDIPDDLLDAMIAQVEPSDEGMIIYTSGTTSQAKGVLHLQRAPTIQSWRIGEQLCIGPQDRIWTAYPFFWSAGISMALGACLAAGATLVLQETFDAGQALQCFVDEKVNATQCWPHQAKAIAEHPLAQILDLSGIDKQAAGRFKKLAAEDDTWGTQGSYGATETFTFSANLPADAPAQLRIKTAGKPLPGMSIKIVDKLSGEPLPCGESGEITVKGVSLMRGYYKVNPEEAVDSDGYFHTQDAGYLDEQGYLHWTGRLSTMIKTGGANVSPLEIEKVLWNYPNMRVGFPFGVAHPTQGEVIVLCAVAMHNTTLDAKAIADFLRDKLASYKRPKSILLFEEKDLSFTGNQKIRFEQLKAKALVRLKTQAIEIEGVNYAEYGVDTAG